ncbi:MAG TPA: caspase family protein [Bradyrhizobium sp.]|nr:caspase family protein [Bradyrhizobium sp.]
MGIRLPLLAVLVFSIAPIFSPPATAADRLALVIGNARYPDADAPLKEPVNDARSIAEELKRNGFTVEVGENLSGDGMRKALERLYGQIKPGSVALVFFSGFGIQSNRQSFLIPIDAQIWTEADVRRDGLSLEAVLGEIHSRGAGVKIALIDASRRNPFERRFRNFSAGLAPVIAPNGTLVMYSAALSSVIPDNGGDRSLFVQELLKEIRVPGLMAEETLNHTRIGVTRSSGSEQVPWISSSLAEEFAFIPGTKPVAVLPSQQAPNPVPSARPSPPMPKAEAALLPSPEKPATPTLPNNPPSSTQPLLADDPTIKSLSARIADNPDDTGALYRRGQVYASKGAYGLAIKDFDDTIRLNPKDVEAYNNRCWSRAQIGDLQAALRDCNEALRLRPNFVEALDSRGLVNLKSGSTKNAIADFDAALKINPRLTSSLYGRGLAKQRSGAVSEGELDVNNAKAMDPNIVKEFAGYGVR